MLACRLWQDLIRFLDGELEQLGLGERLADLLPVLLDEILHVLSPAYALLCECTKVVKRKCERVVRRRENRLVGYLATNLRASGRWPNICAISFENLLRWGATLFSTTFCVSTPLNARVDELERRELREPIRL